MIICNRIKKRTLKSKVERIQEMILTKLFRLIILLVVISAISGCSCCGLFPADGIRSTGGLFNSCNEECRRNADFMETLKHYTLEETQAVLRSGGELEYYKAKHYP